MLYLFLYSAEEIISKFEENVFYCIVEDFYTSEVNK